MIGTMSGTKICQELNEILKCCPGTKSGSSGTKFPSLLLLQSTNVEARETWEQGFLNCGNAYLQCSAKGCFI